MINAGNFYALARAQVDRLNGAECRDQTLVQAAGGLHPTKPSRQRECMETLIPPTEHVRFAAASAWFGNSQPELLIDVYESSADLEARARLVQVDAISAPRDAPCRTWPWQSMERRLGYDRMAGTLVHGRFVDMLGPKYTSQFLADIRHRLTDDWVPITDGVATGLTWVLDDTTDVADVTVATLVIRNLLNEQAMYWPASEPKWTVDSIAAWAYVCADYVQARRG